MLIWGKKKKIEMKSCDRFNLCKLIHIHCFLESGKKKKKKQHKQGLLSPFCRTQVQLVFSSLHIFSKGRLLAYSFCPDWNNVIILTQKKAPKNYDTRHCFSILQNLSISCVLKKDPLVFLSVLENTELCWCNETLGWPAFC